MSKIVESGGFFGRLLGPLLKAGLFLMKNVLTPLPKSVLKPIGLSAAASTKSKGSHKEIIRSGMTTLLILNKQVEVA